MKKTLMACIAVAAISTNCTASEVVGTANTVAQTVASATNAATNVAKHYDPQDENVVVVVEQQDPPKKELPFKWMNAGRDKFNEVIGGREAIDKLQEQNEELLKENRGLRARISFTGENLKPFAASVEKMCYLYDGGGIKEALGEK